MNTRHDGLTCLRPEVSADNFSQQMTTDEHFQNQTLRPVIKLQSPLFIEVFKNYISKHKNVFYDLSLQKKIDYIENAIHKDMKFRNSLKGMVIGVFTIEEYKVYIQNSSALNKRMMHLVKECLLDYVQVFDVLENTPIYA